MIGTRLIEQGWKLHKRESEYYYYQKDDYKFEIYHKANRVFITVPLPGSDSRYRTRLNSSSEAESYLAKHANHLQKN